jgi:hypothetical protein
MVPHLFVIDDFLPDPDAIRAQALSMRYAVGGRYPGLNSTEKLRIEGLDELISNIVRVPLKAPWDESFSHAHFQVSLAEHNDKPARIHIDQSHWLGDPVSQLARGLPGRDRVLPALADRYRPTSDERASAPPVRLRIL